MRHEIKEEKQQANNIAEGFIGNSISLARRRRTVQGQEGRHARPSSAEAMYLGKARSPPLCRTGSSHRDDGDGLTLCKAFPDIKTSCWCKESFQGGCCRRRRDGNMVHQCLRQDTFIAC